MATYGYVGATPLMFSDPSGLYSSEQHMNITRDARGMTSLCPKLATGLDEGVAAADWGGGDFSVWDLFIAQSVGNAHWHGMRQPGETVELARDKMNNFINGQLGSCSQKGLARALHAIQDSTAGGHRDFQVYAGMFSIDSAHHQQDAHPDQRNYDEAVTRSQAMIKDFVHMCPCACR